MAPHPPAHAIHVRLTTDVEPVSSAPVFEIWVSLKKYPKPISWIYYGIVIRRENDWLAVNDEYQFAAADKDRFSAVLDLVSAVLSERKKVRQ